MIIHPISSGREAVNLSGDGLRWENVMVKQATNDIAPYEMLLLLFFDAFPLFILALYVDAVKSGRRPWHFILPVRRLASEVPFRCYSRFSFQRIGWWCIESSSDIADAHGAPTSFDSNSVERTSTEKRASVVIENVIKVLPPLFLRSHASFRDLLAIRSLSATV